MKKEKKKPFIISINILNLILTAIFLGLLIHLNIVPKKYLIILAVSVIIFDIIMVIITHLKSKVLKIIGIVLISISIIIQSIGSYYAYKGNTFFNKSFNNASTQSIITYYVLTYADNKSNTIDDTVYYINDANMESAIKKIKKDTDKELIQNNDITNLFVKLANKEIKYIYVNKSTYEILLDTNKEIKKDNYKVLLEYTVKKKIDKIKSSNNKNTFNLYINGKDFASINDFNMIVSINMDTHKILLTSIPRDYHINIYGMNDMQDNLCFIGMDDVNVSIKSLEQFFDIDIDYYLKINTHSLVELVDAVGGINYCSDISFTTTHSLVLDTYNDTASNKLTIKEGCQHLNGIQTLTLARERLAFPGSDDARQKNCQAIIIDIVEALKDTNTIVNFNKILDTLSNLYETNISKDIVQNIIKDIVDGKKWKFENQSVYGVDSPTGRIHLNSMTGWIMIPNMDSVEKAKVKIKNVLK